MVVRLELLSFKASDFAWCWKLEAQWSPYKTLSTSTTHVPCRGGSSSGPFVLFLPELDAWAREQADEDLEEHPPAAMLSPPGKEVLQQPQPQLPLLLKSGSLTTSWSRQDPRCSHSQSMMPAFAEAQLCCAVLPYSDAPACYPKLVVCIARHCGSISSTSSSAASPEEFKRLWVIMVEPQGFCNLQILYCKDLMPCLVSGCEGPS